MDLKNIDLTDNKQKAMAAILMVVVAIVLWVLLPPLVIILKNLVLTCIFGAILLFIGLNYKNIWNFFKQITWNITKNMISKDKLAYMYRYYDYLQTKLQSLDETIVNLGAIRQKSVNKVNGWISDCNNLKAQAISLENNKATPLVLRTCRTKISTLQSQIDTMIPKVETMKQQESYLRDLYDLRVSDTEELKFILDAKADEYNALKEMSEATGHASEFLKGNSEEYKLYVESLKQIEDSVALYTSNVQNFERKMNPVLEQMKVKGTVSEEIGIQLIEEYKASRLNLK